MVGSSHLNGNNQGFHLYRYKEKGVFMVCIIVVCCLHMWDRWNDAGLHLYQPLMPCVPGSSQLRCKRGQEQVHSPVSRQRSSRSWQRDVFHVAGESIWFVELCGQFRQWMAITGQGFYGPEDWSGMIVMEIVFHLTVILDGCAVLSAFALTSPFLSGWSFLILVSDFNLMISNVLLGNKVIVEYISKGPWFHWLIWHSFYHPLCIDGLWEVLGSVVLVAHGQVVALWMSCFLRRAKDIKGLWKPVIPLRFRQRCCEFGDNC